MRAEIRPEASGCWVLGASTHPAISEFRARAFRAAVAKARRPRLSLMWGDPCYYSCAAGAGMVIVLTLRAPDHAAGGCGSDTGPDGFDGEARSPSGYCEGGSNEFEYRASP